MAAPHELSKMGPEEGVNLPQRFGPIHVGLANAIELFDRRRGQHAVNECADETAPKVGRCHTPVPDKRRICIPKKRRKLVEPFVLPLLKAIGGGPCFLIALLTEEALELLILLAAKILKLNHLLRSEHSKANSCCEHDAEQREHRRDEQFGRVTLERCFRLVE